MCRERIDARHGERALQLFDGARKVFQPHDALPLPPPPPHLHTRRDIVYTWPEPGEAKRAVSPPAASWPRLGSLRALSMRPLRQHIVVAGAGTWHEEAPPPHELDMLQGCVCPGPSCPSVAPALMHERGASSHRHAAGCRPVMVIIPKRSHLSMIKKKKPQEPRHKASCQVPLGIKNKSECCKTKSVTSNSIPTSRPVVPRLLHSCIVRRLCLHGVVPAAGCNPAAIIITPFSLSRSHSLSLSLSLSLARTLSRSPFPPLPHPRLSRSHHLSSRVPSSCRSHVSRICRWCHQPAPAVDSCCCSSRSPTSLVLVLA